MSKKNSFLGSFESNCQDVSVPPLLLHLVEQILKGTGIQSKSGEKTNPVNNAALSISQLIVFNAKEKGKNDPNTSQRSNVDRETPLPLYLGIMIHSKTRKRSVIDTLFELGICVSYNHVMSVSADLGNKLCDFYASVDTVCPPNMMQNTFTLAAVDNIDHNHSSATAKSSFHGTGISLFQNCESLNEQTYPKLTVSTDKKKQL